MLRSVPLSIIINFGRYGGSKMSNFSDFLDSVHQRLVPYRHWFLQTIGVDPKFQGKGFGSKLLRPILTRLDKENLPCYLETIDEKNVPIYENYGFKIIEKSDIPETEFTNWAMLRKFSE
jgi:ribosomal protein S18 acetylase RimI-like enzyme